MNQLVYAEQSVPPKHHVTIRYSADSPLQSKIAHKLAADIRHNYSAITITEVSIDEETPLAAHTDMAVAIGEESIRSAENTPADTSRLFIPTSAKNVTLYADKNSAVLYITQPYCRQMKFIRQLNPHWKTISILNNQASPVGRPRITKCARKLGLNIYTVDTFNDESLTNTIKDALSNSDLLLALPDSDIYNSKTVRNILLTSYHYRKPVIAFSKNFVTAGALASIHSDTQQIAESASELIVHYFEHDRQFEHPVNYPQSFEIKYNRQVSRALGFIPPNPDKIRRVLKLSEPENQGHT